jgi:hypothetical protein
MVKRKPIKRVKKEILPRKIHCDCEKPELIDRVDVAVDGHKFVFCKKCQLNKVRFDEKSS